MNEQTPSVAEESKDLKQNEPITNNAVPISDPVAQVDEDPNWRIVREQRKAERKAREDAERRAAEETAKAKAFQEALEALSNKPSQGQQQNYFNQPEESDDERIEKKVAAALKKREEEYFQQQQQVELREYPQRLRQNIPDFDKVCSAENIDYLEYHHPEIAEPFRYMPEGYKKWEAMYKVAKKLIPNIDAKKDMAKIDKNLAKPGSVSSVGTTQGEGAMSKGAILTEEKKAANWLRMQSARKGLS